MIWLMKKFIFWTQIAFPECIVPTKQMLRHQSPDYTISTFLADLVSMKLYFHNWESARTPIHHESGKVTLEWGGLNFIVNKGMSAHSPRGTPYSLHFLDNPPPRITSQYLPQFTLPNDIASSPSSSFTRSSGGVTFVETTSCKNLTSIPLLTMKFNPPHSSVTLPDSWTRIAMTLPMPKLWYTMILIQGYPDSAYQTVVGMLFLFLGF